MKAWKYSLTFLLIYIGATIYGQTLAEEVMDEYVGNYLPPYTSGLPPMDITKKEGALFYSFKGSNVTTELTFISPAKYSFSDNSKTQIKFEKCNGWEVSHLYLNNGATDKIFIKQKPKQEVTTDMPVACKTVTVTACISYEVNLHIKNNSMFWETVRGVPPGTNNECGVAINVNEKSWTDWSRPYPLGFKTEGLTVQPFVVQKHDFAELIQAPNASNGWETVMHFLDLHRKTHPHTYSVVYYFCPVGSIKEPIVNPTTVDPYFRKEIKIDTALYKRVTIDLTAHKLFFEPGKTELTPAAKLELKNIYDTVKLDNQVVEIVGYEKKGDDDYWEWKLYYERSLSVSIYLVEMGLAPKRVRFLAYYGEDKVEIEKDLEKHIKLSIKDQP